MTYPTRTHSCRHERRKLEELPEGRGLILVCIICGEFWDDPFGPPMENNNDTNQTHPEME